MLQKFFILLNRDLIEVDQRAQSGLSKLKKRKELQIGDHRVKVESKIAEGGYADIFKVSDAQRNGPFSLINTQSQEYALKRMFIAGRGDGESGESKGNDALLGGFGNGFQGAALDLASTQAQDAVRRAFDCEVQALSKLPNCENLVQMIDHQETEKLDGTEVFILLEYCPNGTLFDLIEQKCKLGFEGISDEAELYKILQDISNGLRCLHDRSISHRDLKIENILQGEDSKWKLCDFGSCTTQQYNTQLSMTDREAVQAEIEKVTTPIYRAPEQLDLFKGYKINTKVDIWALGCIMFTLMYHKPPFEDGQKLAQINGKFRLQDSPAYSDDCISLLKAMLRVDPDDRPTAQQIYDRTLKLCGNTKDIVPRIEFKFSPGVQPNQFQSLLKPQSVDKDTRLENFGDNNQFQYSLREPETAEAVKPTTQVAQGAPATSKVGATDEAAMKIRKAIDFMVEDQSENCWQVKIQRGLINLISQDPAPQAYEAAAQKLNAVTQPLEITTCALKFLAVAQNLILYCPDICAGKDLPIFKKMYEKWTDVLEKQASNTADQFRCKFFVKLVAHLSSYISNKLLISKEFDCFIDAALNLKGIIDNSDFKNNSNRRSPLQVQFLSKLNLLWKHLAVLNSKMLEKPLYLKGIRLQLAITLMEEQYQLMCTLTHLFLAFQVTIQLFNTNISEAMLAQVNKFIQDFKLSFHENLESFSQFMISLKSHEELSHLIKKFPPDVPIDLCFVIEDLKDKYIQHHKAKYRNSSLGANDFKLNELLNIDVSVHGLKIPIPFKTYATFHQNCHAHFDFVLCQKPFRDKLGQQYQAQRLKEVPHVQKQEGNEGGGEMFRSRYRSISQKEFSSTVLESRRQSQVRKENFQSIGGESAMRPNQNEAAEMGKVRAAHEKAQRESVISLDGAEQDFLNQSNQVMSYLKTAENGFIGLGQEQAAKKDANYPMKKQPSVQEQLEQVFLQEQAKQGQGSAESQGQGQSKTAAMNISFDNKEHGAPATTQLAAGPPHPQAALASEKQLDPASQNKSQFKSLKFDANIQQSNDDFLMQWNQEYDIQSFKSSQTFNGGDDDLGENTSRSSRFGTSMEPTNIKPAGGNQFVTSLPKDKKGNVQLQESQYDSKASDYFLLLNLKNKNVVQKRNKIKLKSSEEFIEYEQIYAYMKASRGEKELDLMQTLQDKEMLRQTLLLERSKQQESEKKVAEHSEELKRLKTQYDKEKENMTEIQQSYHERSQQLKNEYEERFAQEKMKFVDEKKQMQLKIEHQQQKLAEIHQKLKQKKFQEEKEQETMRSESTQLTQRIAEMQKQLDEAMKKMQEQAASEQKGNKPAEKQGFQPDLENKERNLACQFLDYTLTGREFLKIDLRELTNLKKIGEGAAAVVYQAQYKFTDVAVKKLKVQSLIVNGKLSVEFQREIEALTHISHPNLVLFMGATADEGHPVIVTEFCHGGTLFEVLHEKKTSIPHITFKQRHKMALDIAKGMHFMHSLKPPLMHRDLKSLNLLLSEKVEGPTDFVNVKVTDFGLTRHLSEEENFRMTGQAGTFHWMAPEVLENDSYSEKADVYSYGIVLWEILAREPPFASYTPFQIISKVVQDHERPPLSKISEDCPRELIVIMRACWEQNPQRRPRFSDVIQGLNLVKPSN